MIRRIGVVVPSSWRNPPHGGPLLLAGANSVAHREAQRRPHPVPRHPEVRAAGRDRTRPPAETLRRAGSCCRTHLVVSLRKKEGSLNTAQLSVLSSATLAALALTWSVLSWRRSGPRVQARALLGGNELKLVVVNSGRAPDVVSAIFLGGSGVGVGKDFSALLPRAAHTLESASPLEITIKLDETHAWFLTRARAGFESVFVGLDPLRSVRADVIPIAQLTRASTWQVKYRAGLIRRYLPLASGLALTAASHATTTTADVTVVVLAVALTATVLVWHLMSWRRQAFPRARVERYLTAGALLTALLVAGSAQPHSLSAAPHVTIASYLYLAFGAALAGPTQVATTWARLQKGREWLTRVQPRAPY